MDRAFLEKRLEALEKAAKEIRLQLNQPEVDARIDRILNMDASCQELAERERALRNKYTHEMAAKTWNLVKGKSDAEIIAEIEDTIRFCNFQHRADLAAIIALHENSPELVESSKEKLSRIIGNYGSPTAWALHLEECIPCKTTRQIWAENKTI